MINIKTQTKRSTKFIERLVNVNTFVKDKHKNELEFGIVTSKYWGDFEEREEPLIEISINGRSYQLSLISFIGMVEPKLRGHEA